MTDGTVTNTEEPVTVTDDPEPVAEQPGALSSGLLTGILIILGKTGLERKPVKSVM